jgi:uncharacterized protein (UPF0335 family)
MRFDFSAECRAVFHDCKEILAMTRLLPVGAVLLLLPLADCVAAEPESTETIIRLSVRPAAAPKPALEYQLLPDLREMNPGNPIQAYARCFGEQYNFWHDKEAVQKREKWQTMPLRDLPLEEIRQAGYFGNPLRDADRAARLETPDWQLLILLKKEGPALTLPDLQGLRQLAGALKVRFRAEIAERRIDDALGTARTMFALARHVGEHPTLIGGMVATAVGSLAIDPLEETIQQPGAPNLYWALTDLPHPFIDLRKGVQAERMMMADLFALIDETAPMNEGQLQQAVDRLVRLEKELQMVPNVSAWLKAMSQNGAHVRAVRKQLIDLGVAEDKVKQFSAAQVILVNEKLQYTVRGDEGRKVMSLPYWQAIPILSAVPPRKKGKDRLFHGSLDDGMDYVKVKQVQTRLEQRLALLRCVEALRLYAADHDGRLPVMLADVSVPLPVDPVTGRPFSYKLEDKIGVLRGSPPAGMEKAPWYNCRYEVKMVP